MEEDNPFRITPAEGDANASRIILQYWEASEKRNAQLLYRICEHPTGFYLRRRLAMDYKEQLSKEHWMEFQAFFYKEPLLVADRIQMSQDDAWERRRHLLACWL
jgi:hypothetical protein